MTTAKKAASKKATVKKAVARRNPTPPAEIVPASQSAQFLATIQSAASDQSVDMDKMDRLYAMYKDVKANEARVAYNAAMSLAQKEMGGVEKTHFNPQTKSYFAKVEDIIREVKPIWTGHGFSLTFYEGDAPQPGWINAKCDVSHEAGDTRTFTCLFPIDDKGMAGKVNKTQIHGIRSAKTYAQRYFIGDIFSLEISGAGDDDDGNAAGESREVITDEQALKIESLITDHDMDKDAFMLWVKQTINVERIVDIPADWHKNVIRTINDAIEARKKAEPA